MCVTTLSSLTACAGSMSKAAILNFKKNVKAGSQQSLLAVMLLGSTTQMILRK